MVATPYALSLYLMYMPEDALEKTFFCVYDQIKPDITSQLPHVRVFQYVMNADKNTYWRFRLVAAIKYFFVRFTEIYAMDFLDFVPQLIGRSKYTCIEDGTGSFSFAPHSDVLRPWNLPNTFWGIKRRIQHGSVYGRVMGNNKQCINRLITSQADVDSPYIVGKKYTLVDMREEWVKSTDQKKGNMCKVFNISGTQLEELTKYKTIILTQPLASVGISEKEAVDIYAPYVQEYQQNGVVIKPHPAECTDYAKYFPNAIILQTKAPMQLLTAMGVHFDRAITIFSTAVGTFPKETEIIWLGTEVHPLLYKEVGHVGLEEVSGKR